MIVYSSYIIKAVSKFPVHCTVYTAFWSGIMIGDFLYCNTQKDMFLFKYNVNLTG